MIVIRMAFSVNRYLPLELLPGTSASIRAQSAWRTVDASRLHTAKDAFPLSRKEHA